MEGVEERKYIDFSKKNVLLLLYVFSDGDGDFVFGQKIIKLLLRIGFIKENIQLRIMYHSDINISNFKSAYDKFIGKYNERCSKEYQIIYDTETDYVNIDNNINNAILSLINIFCSKYNFGLDQRIKCEDVKQNKSVLELQEMIQKYIFANKKKLLKLIQTESKTEFTSEDVITPNSSSNNENFKCVIDSKILEDELSKFFLQIFNNKIWSVLINNIITFFREAPELNNNNIKILTKEQLNIITPISVRFTDNIDDNLIISFYYWKIYDQNNKQLDLFDKYPHIRLCEGGNWSGIEKINSYITSGFDTKFELSNHMENSFGNINKPYGINIVENINDDNIMNTGGININEDYHICYFGQIDLKKFTSSNILFLVKLNFFINLIYHKYGKGRKFTNVIYINKIAYDYLLIALKNKTHHVFFDIIENEDVLIINNVKILFYEKVPHADFIKLLAKSKEECILTGDQSYFEGISLGKNVIYDILSHKEGLHRQMFHMYFYFIKYKLSKKDRYNFKIHVGNIMQFKKDFTTSQIENSEQSKNISYDDLSIYTLNEEYKYHHITFKLGGLTKGKYNTSYIINILTSFCILSNYILQNHKNNFLKWLRKDMDFEHNLQTFIKIYLTNFGKSKSKYLKYKIKYLNLK